MQQILLKCKSLNRQDGPLSLIQAITSLYLDRNSPEQLAHVKFAAKVEKNRLALRIYLQRLLYKKNAKLNKTQLLINSAL